MAFPVTLNGRTYTLTDFEGTNYVDGLPDAFEDFVTQAGQIYSTTSTTSNSIGTGSKTFTVEASKPYQVGTPLRIADTAAVSTNWIDGIVTAYSGTTLTVNAVAYAGSGTKTAWSINIGGGPIAYTGTLPIAQGGTGATTAAAARTNIDVYSKADADSRFLNISGDTGDVEFTGDLTISGTGAGTRFMIRSDNDGGADGPFVDLYRNSASPAVNDDLGIIYFSGENDADEKVQYADIHTFIQGAVDGAEDGRMDLRFLANGSVTNAIQMRGDEGGDNGRVLVNASRYDVNFQVASTGKANLITTSGSGDFVNFGVDVDTDYGGLVNIVTSDNSTQLALVSTDADSGHGPIMTMHRLSATPDDDDSLGSIRFQGQNSTDEIKTFARFDCIARNITDGSEAGELQIETTLNGINTSRITMNQNGTYINNSAAALDFRVSTDTITNFMFIDSSRNAMLLTNNTAVTEPDDDAVLHISNSNNNPNLLLECRDGDPNDGPILRFDRVSGTPVDADNGGIIEFRQQNDNSQMATIGRIFTRMNTVADGGEDGRMLFQMLRDGSTTNALDINLNSSENEVVVNQSAHDISFRVETPNLTHALFTTNAGIDGVRVGTSGEISDCRFAVHNGGTGVTQELYRATGTTSADIFKVHSNVGGTEEFVAGIEANGDIMSATQVIQAPSDIKLKQDIVDATSQWDDIKALQLRNYRMKSHVVEMGDDAPTHLGVIAQEVEAAGMTGLVDDKPDVDGDLEGPSTKIVKYTMIYLKAVKALQEAMDRIETLEAKVAALEAN